MGKRSDLAIVKDWQTIRTEFEAMERMSCVPVGIRKVRADHIFDEERSVRWNREMVEKNNADYQAGGGAAEHRKEQAPRRHPRRHLSVDSGRTWATTYHGSRPSASGRMRGSRAMPTGSPTFIATFRIWSSWRRCF